MNKKQLVVIWIGIAVFIFLGVTTETKFGGRLDYAVDYSQLVVRLVGTVLVTGAMVYTLKDKKPKDGQKQ